MKQERDDRGKVRIWRVRVWATRPQTIESGGGEGGLKLRQTRPDQARLKLAGRGGWKGSNCSLQPPNSAHWSKLSGVESKIMESSIIVLGSGKLAWVWSGRRQTLTSEAAADNPTLNTHICLASLVWMRRVRRWNRDPRSKPARHCLASLLPMLCLCLHTTEYSVESCARISPKLIASLLTPFYLFDSVVQRLRPPLQC